MGKNILVGAFLVTSIISVILFFLRDDNSIRDQMEARGKQPVITLEDFFSFRYKGHELKGVVSGHLANFIEPNVVEMYGNVQGKKNEGEKQNFVSAESGAAYLESQGLTQLMKNSTVKRAQLENDVRIGVTQNVLNTEFAEYLADNQVLRSDRPVLIYNSTGRFKGNSGFEYSLQSEDMTVFGPIEGILQSSSVGRAEDK